jgi:hypothetical protein
MRKSEVELVGLEQAYQGGHQPAQLIVEGRPLARLNLDYRCAGPVQDQHGLAELGQVSTITEELSP